MSTLKKTVGDRIHRYDSFVLFHRTFQLVDTAKSERIDSLEIHLSRQSLLTREDRRPPFLVPLCLYH